MTRKVAIVFAGMLGSLALGAPTAGAATVRIAVDKLDVRAGAGEANALTITAGAGGLVIADGAAALTAGRNCTGGGSQVTCSADGVTQMFVDASDGADNVSNGTALPISVSGGPDDDVLNGGPADDTMRGNGGADIIHAGAGNDTIVTRGDVPDAVFCGPGDDTVIADVFDRIVTDPADPEACEHVDRGIPVAGQPPLPPPPGPGAPPFITASPVGTPVPVPVAALGAAPRKGCATPFIGTAASDRIEGGDGNDRIFGLAGDDVLNGLKGDDCIFGVDGNDRLFGGLGDDLLAGGKGNDALSGGDGNDHLSGGAGNDVIRTGAGVNVATAGAGNDDVDARNRRRDTINCGPGRDVAHVDRGDRVTGCERVVRSGAARR